MAAMSTAFVTGSVLAVAPRRVLGTRSPCMIAASPMLICRGWRFAGSLERGFDDVDRLDADVAASSRLRPAAGAATIKAATGGAWTSFGAVSVTHRPSAPGTRRIALSDADERPSATRAN